MLGVLQSHFKVAGGRLVVKSKGVGFRSFHGTFGLILIYAAREHQSCFRSLLRSFQQHCGDTRIGGLIRRTNVLLASVAEMQHGQAFWLVFPARVLTSSFNRHPMRGGMRITRGGQHAHRHVGAGREKTLRCRRCSRRTFRSTRDGGGSSNHRAIVCATLQGAPDHCSELDRLLSGRSYRWKLRR